MFVFLFRYADAGAIELKTGRPRIGMLFRGVSKFSEVTDCPETICQPDATEIREPTRESQSVTN